MQAAQHVLCRPRVIVLYEARREAGQFSEAAGVEAFVEESARVTETSGSMQRTSGIEVGLVFMSVFRLAPMPA